MPQVDQVRSRPHRSAIVVAVVLSVLVLAGVVAVVFLMKAKPEDTASTTHLALNNAEDKSFSGDKDAAIALLLPQLAKATTNDEKLSLYLALGTNYESKPDYPKAMEAYRHAESIKASYGTNEAIARVAESTGDKAVALDYYGRNRQLIKSGQAQQQLDNLNYVEESITRLGGTLK